MAKELGVEWINAYDCLNPLTDEPKDAGGYYDELVNHEGWIGSFNWGDANAWEEDFKCASKGGTASSWVDAVDFTYFTGHGSPWGFYFRCDAPDDNLVECDGYSGPSNGDLRLGRGDLDWLALEVCNVLQLDATLGANNLDVFDRWADAFQGLHTIMSFTTVSLDLPTPGRYFAALCDGRWPSHEVAAAIRDRLASRKKCGSRDASLRDLQLIDWADEFSGGPDLLTPWYFAEIELADPRYTGQEPIQGPRQVLRVPAYR